MNNSPPLVSPPLASVALLADEPAAAAFATCPMCHTLAALTKSGLEAGGAWRCTRCGQHWDAGRLRAVAAYALWVDRDRLDRTP